MLSFNRRTSRDKRSLRILEKWVHRNRSRSRTQVSHLTKDQCWKKKIQDDLSRIDHQKKKKVILMFSESEGSSDEYEHIERPKKHFRKRKQSKDDVSFEGIKNFFPDSSFYVAQTNTQGGRMFNWEKNPKKLEDLSVTRIDAFFSQNNAEILPSNEKSVQTGFFSPFFSSTLVGTVEEKSSDLNVRPPNTNILGMIRNDVNSFFKMGKQEPPTTQSEGNYCCFETDYDGDVIMRDSSKDRQSLFGTKDELAFTFHNILEYGILSLDFCHMMIRNFREGKILHQTAVHHVLYSAKVLFSNLPNCIDIDLPQNGTAEVPHHITIVGDTHGQFFDMLKIFEQNGYPSETNHYLFNGDFVDRGENGVEIVLVLCLFKLVFPNSFHVLRGNHECREINLRHGFQAEVLEKYSPEVFEAFQECFQSLPICAVVNKKVFVCHGGLTEKADLTIRDINEQIERHGVIPPAGIFTDLMWSDPRANIQGIAPSERGASIVFGLDWVKNFLNNNNLSLVVRSHEFKELGYETMGDGPDLITVFSAPNYVGKMNNLGAYIRFKNDSCTPEFFQFS